MRTTRVALVLLTGLSLCACGSDDDATKKFTLGALVAQSGNNADVAYGKTVELAVDQLNEALSKEGEDFRIKLELQDSQAVPEIAMERGLDAVQNKGARMLVFDTSQDVATAAKSYYDDDTSNDLGVVLMDGLGSGSGIIKPPGDGVEAWQVDVDNWIWRTVMSSTPAAYTAIDVLTTYTPDGHTLGDVNGDGVIKISMFGTNDALGKALLPDATTRAKAILGEDIVIEQAYHEAGLSVDSTTAWTTFVTELLDANDDATNDDGTTTSVAGHVPDMLFTGLQVLYNVPTYKAYKNTGSNVPLMGSLAMRNSVFLTEVGTSADGAECVGFATYAPTDSGEQFAADFLAYDGSPGGTSSLYDATVVSALAVIIAAHATGDVDIVSNDDIKAALPQTSAADGVEVNTGIDGLRAAIRAVKSGQPINYDGAGGPCDFDAYGDVRSYLSRSVVQSGEWVTSELYDCTQSSDTCVLLQ